MEKSVGSCTSTTKTPAPVACGCPGGHQDAVAGPDADLVEVLEHPRRVLGVDLRRPARRVDVVAPTHPDGRVVAVGRRARTRPRSCRSRSAGGRAANARVGWTCTGSRWPASSSLTSRPVSAGPAGASAPTPSSRRGRRPRRRRTAPVGSPAAADVRLVGAVHGRRQPLLGTARRRQLDPAQRGQPLAAEVEVVDHVRWHHDRAHPVEPTARARKQSPGQRFPRTSRRPTGCRARRTRLRRRAQAPSASPGGRGPGAGRRAAGRHPSTGCEEHRASTGEAGGGGREGGDGLVGPRPGGDHADVVDAQLDERAAALDERRRRLARLEPGARSSSRSRRRAGRSRRTAARSTAELVADGRAAVGDVEDVARVGVAGDERQRAPLPGAADEDRRSGRSGAGLLSGRSSR